MNGRCRGHTLVELVMALVLTGLVGSVLVRALLIIRRAATAQLEVAAAEGSLRGAALLATAELRELGSDGSTQDLLAVAPESLTYRATRGGGVACRISPAEVVLDSTLRSGFRQPQPGRDSLQVFVEGEPLTRADDRWVRLPILSVAADTCRGGAALALGTVLDTTSVPLDAVDSLTPVRIFEIMQLKLYQSGGAFWLGARSVSAGENIQPVLGPLAATGLELTGLDSAGTASVSPAQIRALRIVLRAIPVQAVHWGGTAPARLRRDSLELVLSLRNGP